MYPTSTNAPDLCFSFGFQVGALRLLSIPVIRTSRNPYYVDRQGSILRSSTGRRADAEVDADAEMDADAHKAKFPRLPGGIGSLLEPFSLIGSRSCAG